MARLRPRSSSLTAKMTPRRPRLSNPRPNVPRRRRIVTQSLAEKSEHSTAARLEVNLLSLKYLVARVTNSVAFDTITTNQRHFITIVIQSQ